MNFESVFQVESELKILINLSPQKFFELRQQRFLQHISLMFDKSDYWKNLLRKCGIVHKSDLPQSVSDIQKLPIMTRQNLMEWTALQEKLLNEDNKFSTIHTSGTSGKPINVDYSKKTFSIGWGELGLRSLLLMGINPKEKGIMLTAYDEEKKISHSSHVNTLALKSILGDNLIDQPINRPLNESLDKIINERVKWIGTVPVFFNASAIRAKEKNINLKELGIKTLFYGGVSFPQHLLEFVKECYDAEIIGFYPSTELCAAGAQVSDKNKFFNSKEFEKGQYVLFSDWIIFELLDENNIPVKEGETGRIIATPLFMDGTPLIRYDIGDQAVFHGFKNNLIIVSDIKRANAIYFSNGKFHYYEVEEMQRQIAKKTGMQITGLQVAKILGEKDIELPILRIETRQPLNEEEKKILSEAAVSSFRSNEHIDMMIDRGIHGGIHNPVVEFYNYKDLVAEGAFKPKLASDETDFWASYAFLQHKVQEHMTPIKELADYSVEGLKGCSSVVDLASGAGYFTSRFAQEGMNVDCVDSNATMLHYAKKKIREMNLNSKVAFHQKQIYYTNFDSHSKEAVHMSNILCYLENPDGVLLEAKRILKHHGKLALAEPGKKFDLDSISKLRKISQADVERNPHIAPYFNAFVMYNQKMTQSMKSLFDLNEMKEKLNNLGFGILEEKSTYADSAYLLLCELFKMSEFRHNILDLQPMCRPFEKRISDEFLRLDLNERTSPPSPKAIKALADFLDSGKVHLYPSEDKLKEKICSYANVQSNEIMITNGSCQAIDIVFRSVLKENDSVIIPSPTFEVFQQYASIQGASIIEVHYKSDGSFPLEEILSSINKSTKLIAICNPNNPTGTLIQRDEIEKILKFSRKICVLVDEAYFEFSNFTCADLINKHPNLIVTRTFSKAFGLASLRIGYVISNELNISQLSKLLSPFDVNVPGQVAALAALDDLEHMKNYASEVMLLAKPLLENFLAQKNIRYLPSSGNFLFAKFSNPAEIKKHLKERGILVCTKIGKNIGDGVRITIGTQNQMELLMNQISSLSL